MSVLKGRILHQCGGFTAEHRQTEATGGELVAGLLNYSQKNTKNRKGEVCRSIVKGVLMATSDPSSQLRLVAKRELCSIAAGVLK